MSNKTNQWINIGVVAALVFSVPRSCFAERCFFRSVFFSVGLPIGAGDMVLAG